MSSEIFELTSLLLIVATSFKVAAQGYGSDCPPEWLSYGDQCYQFVFGQPKPYREAAATCWLAGGALVSINTVEENRFLTDFLNTHARETTSVWYTSGQYTSGSIKWHGDGTFTNTANTDVADYWYNDVSPGVTVTTLIVEFKYSARYQTYQWTADGVGIDLHNYICEVPKSEVLRIIQQSRDFSYGVNSTDQTAIPEGPRFLAQPVSLVVVGGELPANLDCSAVGNPPPVYTWFEIRADFGNQRLGTVTGITSTTDPRYTLTNGHLSISRPTENSDAGVYQCKAENHYGSILSEPARLSFGYLNQYSPNTPGAVEAKRNQGSFINCIAPSAKPALAYAWYKDTVSNFIRPELDDYYFVSANGNLYLSEVQDSNAGNYYCVVTLISSVDGKLSTLQPPSRTSKGIQLIVKNSPAQEYGPIFHPDFINVYPKPPMVDNEVQMECFAYGRMPMQYSWFREGRDFPPGTYFRYDNRVLVIPNAQLADGGNYTCKVEKLSGVQSVAFKSFVLTLEAKPSVIVPLRNMHADVDSALTWRCEVTAIPRATYSWYKNSMLLQRVPGEIDVRENVLVIQRLDAARDNGMYQCMATNQHGTSVSSAQLRVLSIKPSFVKDPLPSTLVASQGGNLTIRCTPEAAPAPEITWLHNGNAIGFGDGRAQILLDGTLHVTQMTNADSGYYTCKASNINGEDQSTTRVLVFEGMQFIRKPVDTSGVVNRTIFLYCEISYNSVQLDLVYIWTFNGRLIDTRQNLFYRLGDARARGLYIVNAQFDHTGLYECVGQTVTSEISAYAQVTVTGPPGEPAGVFVVVGMARNNSARLEWTWNPAANHGFPVTYFQLEASTDFTPEWHILLPDIPAHLTLLSSDATRRYIDVDGLLPHNSYTFRVRAKNDMGVGPPSRPSDLYRVPSAAPVVAPRSVGGGGGKVGLLCMSWQSLGPHEEGGTGFGYIVYWKVASNGNLKPKQQDVGNVSRHCETVGEENYYILYEVWVHAYNTIGAGPMSQIGLVFSAEGMPAIVPTNVNFETINGTAIVVYWRPIPNTRDAVKGQVLGYRIDYWDADRPEGISDSTYIYCDCGEGLVIGLVPDSNFWVRVSVFNSAGLGVPSERYLASTNQFPTSQYPEYVKIFPHGDHSMRVEWRGVGLLNKEAALKGFKLLYWPVGDDIRSANFTKTDRVTSTVIYGLQHDVIYNLRVMAVNLGGDGKKSPTVYFTVLKGGVIRVDMNEFDPSTSQLMFASAPVNNISIILTVICVLYHMVAF